MQTDIVGVVAVVALAGCVGCGPRVASDETSGAGSVTTAPSPDSASGTAADTGTSGATAGSGDTTVDTGTAVDDSGSSEETEANVDDDACELRSVDEAVYVAIEEELQGIAESALAYFAVPTGVPPLHRCPHVDQSPHGGSSGITPPLAVNCNCGPSGGCIPTSDPSSEDQGSYDIKLWRENQIWQGLGFERPAGLAHQFHYEFAAENLDDGSGACEFRVTGRADYDDDTEFSVYSVSGFVDEKGAVIEPMVVERPFE